MIDPTTRLALCARSHAVRRDLEDFAQRQSQRERTLAAVAHHQQKLTTRLQHLVRDVDRLGDGMTQPEDRAHPARTTYRMQPMHPPHPIRPVPPPRPTASAVSPDTSPAEPTTPAVLRDGVAPDRTRGAN